MSKSEFFVDHLKLEVKHVLREKPELADNKNGLVLAVWELSGLKLRRRQPVSAFLLPEIDDIMAAAKKCKVQKELAARDDLEASFSDDDPDFLADPNEPKPKVRKIKVNGRAKK